MNKIAIRIFKLIYFAKISKILHKKVKETSSEIDDKFLLTLEKFLQEL